jgi:prevent-host-death family protein
MSVSVRELKTHLSEYLRRAQAGETLEVTSHGEVVARLVPPPAAGMAPSEILREQPWIVPGSSGWRFGLEVPVELLGEGPAPSELLLEDRE